MEFKKRFLEISGFNSQEYEVVTYDCVSLYTSINIDLVLEYILDQIYSDPIKFFPPDKKTVTIKKIATVKTLQPPSRNTLKSFFKNILTDYNNFHALTGFYKQINGCSMGSKLSPSFANIFCSLFENKIIEPEITSGRILHYSRYVDDIFCVLRKGEKNNLLEKLNLFDTDLEFTMNIMIESKITFLDTSVILNGDTMHLEQFRKSTASDVLVNYHTSVSPKSYKISTLVGELYRCNNTTSTSVARDAAIENTKNIFLKNRFPIKLINQKISELKNKDFRPSDGKQRRQEEFDDPDLDHHTLSLPFSSFRCSQIAHNIYKILKNITPFFKLHIVFSTLKLASVIYPRLKPKTEYFNNSCTVYKYDCVEECSSNYIGESERLLHKRILEHRTRSDSHVCQHITVCTHYQNALYQQFEIDPDNLPNKHKMAHYGRIFIHERFTILETNITNGFHRKIFEGLHITLHQPDLNKQVKHEKMNLICKCLVTESIT